MKYYYEQNNHLFSSDAEISDPAFVLLTEEEYTRRLAESETLRERYPDYVYSDDSEII